MSEGFKIGAGIALGMILCDVVIDILRRLLKPTLDYLKGRK